MAAPLVVDVAVDLKNGKPFHLHTAGYLAKSSETPTGSRKRFSCAKKKKLQNIQCLSLSIVLVFFLFSQSELICTMVLCFDCCFVPFLLMLFGVSSFGRPLLLEIRQSCGMCQAYAAYVVLSFRSKVAPSSAPGRSHLPQRFCWYQAVSTGMF